jgi:uncharacterized protein
MPFIFKAESSEIVEVKHSKIRGAGQGLFTKKAIKKGEFLCHYFGVYVDKDSVQNGYYDSDYLLQERGNDLIIDAADPLSCLGRYANDSLSRKKTNSIFKFYNNTYGASINASKAIKKGEEIYVSYGSEFWKEEHRYNILSAADKRHIDNDVDDDSD